LAVDSCFVSSQISNPKNFSLSRFPEVSNAMECRVLACIDPTGRSIKCTKAVPRHHQNVFLSSPKTSKIKQSIDPNHTFSRMTSHYQEAIYGPHNTAQKAKMSSTTTSYDDNKWYSFLLPTNEQQTPVAIYDAPLRRPLFQHAKAGNEETQSARRYSVASIGSERRRSSVASALNPFSTKRH
jgi:hypothetical protein